MTCDRTLKISIGSLERVRTAGLVAQNRLMLERRCKWSLLAIDLKTYASRVR